MHVNALVNCLKLDEIVVLEPIYLYRFKQIIDSLDIESYLYFYKYRSTSFPLGNIGLATGTEWFYAFHNSVKKLSKMIDFEVYFEVVYFIYPSPGKTNNF